MSVKKAYTDRELVETYDHRHFGGRQGRHILHKDCKALESLLKASKGPVLDIPCGTGVYTTVLKGDRRKVVAADVSSSMLAKAMRRDDDVLGVSCDINNLPFKDGAFSAVITLRLFQHYPRQDVGHMLHELKRVVTPGGRVVFDTFRWTPRRWPLLRRFLEKEEMYVYSHKNVEAMIRAVGLDKSRQISLYLFSPIWQRKLPLWILLVLGMVEAAIPQGWLLRTFWACTKS